MLSMTDSGSELIMDHILKPMTQMIVVTRAQQTSNP